MRAVIQRVNKASVAVENNTIGEIGKGYLILLGIENNDNNNDVGWLCRKIANIRLFSDNSGKMNLSLSDVSGEVLVVSQFTLHASTKKGNRPSFIKAARPEVAIPLYEKFIESMAQQINKPVKTGKFGAMMEVGLVNDGPVTIIIDTKNGE